MDACERLKAIEGIMKKKNGQFWLGKIVYKVNTNKK